MSVEPTGSNFIRDIVAEDLTSGRHSSIVTRFPPEPNGYLHLGHAKSIVLNFGLAEEFGGHCYLDWTTPIPRKRKRTSTRRSDAMLNGSATIGGNIYVMLLIILISCTSGRRI